MEFNSALIDAVAKGDSDSVAYLVRMGASVNTPDSLGRCALHWTATSSDAERLVPQLIKLGANTDSTDNLGYTPLHQLSAKGYEYGTSCLLYNGMDVNIKNSITGKTALDLAVTYKREALITLLLAYGATRSTTEET